MLSLAGVNYRRELEDLEPLQLPLNRVFLGPAGTGKTTVAKLFGRVLATLGLLSIRECTSHFLPASIERLLIQS